MKFVQEYRVRAETQQPNKSLGLNMKESTWALCKVNFTWFSIQQLMRTRVREYIVSKIA